jgi:hypothetical protein
MLRVIADQPAIRKFARQFIRKFKPFIDEKINIKLGHQGASFPAKVFWSKKLGIWIFSHAIKEIRYWNAFGVGKPAPGEVLSTTAEINFPWSGIDRKTGGAFAADAWGGIYTIHRGKIGGGKKGVGKSLFEQNYRGVWSFMEDGDCVTQAAVIGALTSERFALQAAQFVKKIEILKSSAVRCAQTRLNFAEIAFREDLVGDLPVSGEPDIAADCDRDLVISSLAALLRRWKYRIGNDDNHELFVLDPAGSRISHAFEILTDTRERSILAAAARLLMQACAEAEKSLLVLVMPEDKINQYQHVLRQMGIAVIGFRLEEDGIIFPDLRKIRLDQNSQL